MRILAMTMLAILLVACTSPELQKAETDLIRRQQALEARLDAIPTTDPNYPMVRDELASVASQIVAVRREQAEYKKTQAAKWAGIAGSSAEGIAGLAGTFFPALAPIFSMVGGLASTLTRKQGAPA